MAATILLVAFVGLMQAITQGSEALDMARKQQVASQLITAEIETLRSGNWTRISALPTSATIAIGSDAAITGDTTAFALSNFSASSGDDNAALASLAPGFTCSYTLSRLRPTSASAATVTFLRIAYTVTWTGNTGGSHRQSREAYFARNGLHLSYQQS